MRKPGYAIVLGTLFEAIGIGFNRDVTALPLSRAYFNAICTELFAKIYKSYGLDTVRYPVLEIEARVEPFENGRGFTLRALEARAPRRH